MKRLLPRAWLVLAAGCACALLATALPAPAAAQSFDRIFTAANEAYFRGDYKAAVAQYERLVDAGVHDPDVYFNLATARARLGNLGHAVLYFERCLWLRASDEGAQQGLTAARALLGKRRAERDGEAVMQARPPLSQALVASIPADALAWVVLVLDALFFAALLAVARVHKDSWRLGLTIAVPLIGLVLLAGGAGLAVKAHALAEGEDAIVLRDGAELREGPDPAAQVRTQAHEGESAEVLRREGSYARVRLSQGAHGWINNKDIEQIRPN